MSNIIKSMAGVNLPDSLKSQLQVKELIASFTADYKELDNLKNAREKHESRSAIARWWNSDELEEAQLDAQELQARFSKKLGQLMAISIEQSRMLSSQQDDLKSQQSKIQKQTAQLKSNSEDLASQQTDLEQQNQELNKLVKEYFALKGLTEEGATKLIQIAKEVKATKTNLLAEFDERLAVIKFLREDVIEKMAHLTQQQHATLTDFQQSLSGEYQALSAQVAESEQSREKYNVQLSKEMTVIDETLARLNSQQEDDRNAQNQQLAEQQNQWQEAQSELRKLFDGQQIENQESIETLKKQFGHDLSTLGQQVTANQSQTSEDLLALQEKTDDRLKALNVGFDDSHSKLTESINALETQRAADISRQEQNWKEEKQQLESNLRTTRYACGGGFVLVSSAIVVLGLVLKGVIVI
ncbi:hypothetical protein EOPP23_14740 [Endozoicomonas sp. OPT23]|uniref:hypothetical protein n=1 Tax=Endozoicomonas sp. OPT23 TaxID=2072845 RepID=UPI00129B3D6C|nr:hypothetical protein [Endozoicomonas sp. OPT23]MRI34249.1 hypothetical protein [Endozoicomonas sp. OPT23]